MNQHRIYRFNDFQVDPESWSLVRDGEEVHVEPVVLELLMYLIAHRDRLVTRRELMDTVWGDTVISEAALSKAVARLRKALGDDSVTHRYLETVYSRGYRFIAEVEEIGAGEGRGLPSRGKGGSAVRRGRYAGTVVAVALVLLGVFWLRSPEQDSLPAHGIVSLAVLPLSNLTGDAGQDYYADGLQDLLITELSQTPGLRLISRQSTRRYRDSPQPATAIAGELGVDVLVEGSLLRGGSRTEVTIQLVDGHSDEHLWAERYARDTPYVYDLVADIAQAIASTIAADVTAAGPGEPTHALISPVDPQAIEAYSRGLMHLDRYAPADIRTAVEQFRKAVGIEPGFALAWGQLAVAHAMRGLYGYAPPRDAIEAARGAALKAIEADEDFFIGHSTIGWVRLWTGDHEGGCHAFANALRLNPSDPYAIHGDADCLMLDARLDESVARVRELLVVSPFSGLQSRTLPYHLFLARRYDDAVAAAMAARERVPVLAMHYLLAWVYWEQGRFDEALAEERLELERRGDTVLLAALEQGLAAGGPMGAMGAMADALVDRAHDGYVDPFEIGKTFARAGRVDEALHWLEKAVDFGSYEINYLAFRPDFDVLRDDSRYRDLVARIYDRQSPASRL